jgi:virulence-associated protein VagC
MKRCQDELRIPKEFSLDIFIVLIIVFHRNRGNIPLENSSKTCHDFPGDLKKNTKFLNNFPLNSKNNHPTKERKLF